MNILHISTPITWRGGEQQLVYLAEGLINKATEQYFVCAENGAIHDYCLEHDLVSFPVRTGATHALYNAGLIKRICRNFEIDLIHTHDSGAHSLAYMAGLAGNPTPLIVSRKVDFEVGKSFLSRKKYNSSKIAAYLCVSKEIERILSPVIRNTSLLKVVYDGIETQIALQKPQLRTLLNLPANSFIVGNVAALAPHKDFFTWVDSAALLLQKDERFHFILVGAGKLDTAIRRYIEQKGLTSHFTLTGFREDAKEILSGFDVFLNTSKTEGLGSSILDAFVREVPVVATAAGGVPEIIKDGVTGLLAPVGDAAAIADKVISILNNVQLKDTLIKNAKQFALNFDKSVMVDKTFQIYNEVLSLRRK